MRQTNSIRRRGRRPAILAALVLVAGNVVLMTGTAHAAASNSLTLGGKKTGKHGYLLFEHSGEDGMRPVDGQTLAVTDLVNSSPSIVTDRKGDRWCSDAMAKNSRVRPAPVPP